MHKPKIWISLVCALLLLCPLLFPANAAGTMGEAPKESVVGEGAPLAEMGEAVENAVNHTTAGQIAAVILGALIVVALVVFIFVWMPKHRP